MSNSTIWSDAFRSFTEGHLARRAEALAPLRGAMREAERGLDPDEALLARYFYATLPVPDAFDTAPEVLASYARHACMLRREAAWCRELDEPRFVHFVAYPRINTEPVTDCRPVFWAELKERVAGMDAEQAVLETNYWCAEKATYQASDERTLGPLGVLASGDGRCGEESTFLVTALRSIGVAARQMYTPWWAHCDDNHAWVEAWVGGRWRYLGACEPEQALDRGWFTAASGRAMAVQTRTYSSFGLEGDCARGLVTHEGDMLVLNATASYAPVTDLEVTVVDAEGAPAAHVDVELAVLNMAAWRAIARMVTDDRGKARYQVGKGSLRVTARTADAEADVLVSTAGASSATLELRSVAAARPAEDWREIDLRAPADHPAPSCALTPAQQRAGKRRKAEADRLRAERLASLRAAAAEAAGRVRASYADAGLTLDDATGTRSVEDLFALSFANAPEVEAFLTADIALDRAELLSTLTDKDFRDLSAAVLEDHLRQARAVRGRALGRLAAEGAGADAARDLFRTCVLAPRVRFEQLAAYRTPLKALLSDGQRAALLANPAAIWTWVRETTRFDPAKQLMSLAASPVGALASHQANPATQRVAFVAVARTLGIAARLNPVSLEPEYYEHGSFKLAEAPDDAPRATLTLTAEGAPVYEQDWSLSQAVPATAPSGAACRQFRVLDLYGEPFEEGALTVDLTPGLYRLTTTVRLPNGNQQACERELLIPEAGRSFAAELRQRAPQAADMLSEIELDDFALADAQGAEVPASELLRVDEAEFALLSVLEPGEEPTEHLLNELREHAARVNEANLGLVCVAPTADAPENDPTLGRARAALPRMRMATCDYAELPERLARRMFANPEKLPLAVLVDLRGGALTGRYASAGYNVGTVDLILKLVRLARGE